MADAGLLLVAGRRDGAVNVLRLGDAHHSGHGKPKGNGLDTHHSGHGEPEANGSAGGHGSRLPTGQPATLPPPPDAATPTTTAAASVPCAEGSDDARAEPTAEGVVAAGSDEGAASERAGEATLEPVRRSPWP